MRQFLLAAMVAASIFATVTPINRAEAMTPAAPSQLGVASTGAGFEKARWGCGWRGCVLGWHRYYRSYYPHPYPYRYFVVPRFPIWIGPRPWYGPRWGWRHRYWRHW